MNSNKSKLLNITLGINFLASLAFNIAMIMILFQISLSRLKDQYSTSGISILVALVFVYFFMNLLLYRLLIKPDEIIGLGRYLGMAFLMLSASIICGGIISVLSFSMI